MVAATEKQVKERPILFSGAMVRAILEGRKTQTRRIIKLPSWSTQSWEDFEVYENNSVEAICASTGCSADILCPYGKKGDRLWVRETWNQCPDGSFGYKATDLADSESERCFQELGLKWKPSIHMPRKASRINLIIKNIRVEKLQEISKEDAIAEGVPPFNWDDGKSLRPITAFRTLWDSINSDRGYSWDSNPFVWVVEFEQEVK